LELGQGLIKPVECDQYAAEVIVDLGIVRLFCQRCAEGLLCLLELSLPIEGNAEVRARVDMAVIYF